MRSSRSLRVNESRAPANASIYPRSQLQYRGERGPGGPFYMRRQWRGRARGQNRY